MCMCHSVCGVQFVELNFSSHIYMGSRAVSEVSRLA